MTKIVATVGPACADETMLGKLIEAGVSVFRLNFSHGDLSQCERWLASIRAQSLRLKRPVAVLGDLQGPKIRVGVVVKPGVDLRAGDTVFFQRQSIEARANARPARFSSTYPRLVDEVKPGHRVLINDGAIRLLVLAAADDALECTVTVGGLVTSGKGINLPDSTVSVESMSDRDRACAAWAVKHELDYLALSFVRSGADITGLRCLLAQDGGMSQQDVPPIIAKIELPEAVKRIDEILDAADGIMVARGDLGVEMELARVPVVQKQLIESAQSFGKPCIVATQMLESMIVSPSPTRAEASDVANAIFDGADAVMLSGETAIGKHAALAVDHMRLIALHTEAYLREQPWVESPPARLVTSQYRTAALAHGVWTVAKDYGAALVFAWSQRGGGARLLSQNGFRIPILAASSDPRALRHMQLLRSVTPVHMPCPRDLAHFTRLADELIVRDGWAKPGDRCILVAGNPIGTAKATNSMAMHEVGSATTGYFSA